MDTKRITHYSILKIKLIKQIQINNFVHVFSEYKFQLII